MKVRKLRLFRTKHSISLEELGAAAGISKQRISELELGESSVTKPLEDKISGAFLEILASRLLALSEFELDYEKHKDSLFELVENDHGL